MGRSGGGSGGGGRSGGFSSGGRVGGGGFSSGGRSHIGGGGRSAGGFSSGGRSGVGGFNSGSSFSGPVYRRGGYHHHGYGGWGLGRRWGWGRRRSGCGCSAVVGLFVILLMLAVVYSAGGLTGRNLSSPTRESYNPVTVQPYVLRRTPIDPSLSKETRWYQDNNTGADAWVSNSVRMEEGLRAFYRKTGVRPFVLIHTREQAAAMLFQKTDDERFAYAQEQYHALFSDEAHALFIISDDGSENWRYDDYIGAQAKSVVDLEVINLIYDKLDYYWQTDCDEETLFYSAFRDAADSISTEKPPVVERP